MTTNLFGGRDGGRGGREGRGGEGRGGEGRGGMEGKGVRGGRGGGGRERKMNLLCHWSNMYVAIQ